MSSQQRSLRTASLTLLGPLLLGVLLAPVAVASGDLQSCRVRNVTQGTGGASFRTMVAAAVDGDRLTVRGTCEGGRVVIRADLVVTGVGDPRPVLTGRHRHRVLLVGGTATVALRHLVVADGWRGKASPGGGIGNWGTLTITDSVVRGNTAFMSAGGIRNEGTLTITDSVVRGNKARFSGGIGNWDGGTLTITDSVVRGNTAEDGGGIGIHSEGTMTITDSVVRGNTAELGGGIQNYGTTTITDSVVRGNKAEGGGGGIDNEGTMTITDSVVRDNKAEYGGGIYHGGGIRLEGTLTITDSVVRDNTAESEGGGILNYGSLTLDRSVVTANTADGPGGGIWNNDDFDFDPVGSVTMQGGSTVTGNTPDDCYGTTAC